MSTKRQVQELNKEYIAFLGTYTPRECGIATFTKDLVDSIDLLGEFAPARVISVNEIETIYDYDSRVKQQIRQDFEEDYIQAAKYINSSRIKRSKRTTRIRNIRRRMGKVPPLLLTKRTQTSYNHTPHSPTRL